MAVLTVTPELLDLALRYNGFPPPEKGLVFFGIRGAFPDNPDSLDFASARPVVLGGFDHLGMRCSIGQWDRERRALALFPASTVPSIGSIAAAKANGGEGTNLLIPGRYEFSKGEHKAGKPSGHRAFRQATFFPVRRTADDTAYDNFDRIDFGSGPGDFVGDNLHSAYHELPDRRFSSAGCQVVSGLPKSPQRGGARETGAWRRFVDNAYALAQERFTYVLFPATELAMLAAADPAAIRQVVRYGSAGAAARMVQTALINAGDLAGTADGSFGRTSTRALADFQRRMLGPGAVDGVCGPATAAALRIELPFVADATVPKTAAAAATPDGPVRDLPDETDLSPVALRDAMQRSGLARHIPAAGGAPRQAGLSRQAFFDACRRSLFGGSIGTTQVRGMEDVLDRWEAEAPDGDPRWLAYIMASIFHETGQRMVPVREGFKDTDEAAREHVRRLFTAGRIKRDYAIPVSGISYFGRGRVQMTHFDNYVRSSRRFGQDFVHHPELLLDSRIDAQVAVVGHIEGLWTGVKLADVINGHRCDYVSARRIVNGQDRADLIAGHARLFESAIATALAAGGPVRATAGVVVTGEPAAPPAAAVRPRPEPVPETAGDLLMSSEADQINLRIDLLENRIRDLLQPNRGMDPPVSEATATVDGTVRTVKEVVQEIIAKDPRLTPVNNALGPAIGNALNGRKTAIGVIGSVLTSMVGSAPVDTVPAKLATAVTSVLPALGGLSGPLLPVFLGLAAWGVLGKQEKWNLGQIVSRQQTPP